MAGVQGRGQQVRGHGETIPEVRPAAGRAAAPATAGRPWPSARDTSPKVPMSGTAVRLRSEGDPLPRSVLEDRINVTSISLTAAATGKADAVVVGVYATETAGRQGRRPAPPAPRRCDAALGGSPAPRRSTGSAPPERGRAHPAAGAGRRQGAADRRGRPRQGPRQGRGRPDRTCCAGPPRSPRARWPARPRPSFALPAADDRAGRARSPRACCWAPTPTRAVKAPNEGRARARSAEAVLATAGRRAGRGEDGRGAGRPTWPAR